MGQGFQPDSPRCQPFGTPTKLGTHWPLGSAGVTTEDLCLLSLVPSLVRHSLTEAVLLKVRRLGLADPTLGAVVLSTTTHLSYMVGQPPPNLCYS